MGKYGIAKIYSDLLILPVVSFALLSNGAFPVILASPTGKLDGAQGIFLWRLTDKWYFNYIVYKYNILVKFQLFQNTYLDNSLSCFRRILMESS